MKRADIVPGTVYAIEDRISGFSPIVFLSADLHAHDLGKRGIRKLRLNEKDITRAKTSPSAYSGTDYGLIAMTSLGKRPDDDAVAIMRSAIIDEHIDAALLGRSVVSPGVILRLFVNLGSVTMTWEEAQGLIAERKAAEEALKQKRRDREQRAQDVLRALGDFDVAPNRIGSKFSLSLEQAEELAATLNRLREQALEDNS